MLLGRTTTCYLDVEQINILQHNLADRVKSPAPCAICGGHLLQLVGSVLLIPVIASRHVEPDSDQLLMDLTVAVECPTCGLQHYLRARSLGVELDIDNEEQEVAVIVNRLSTSTVSHNA